MGGRSRCELAGGSRPIAPTIRGRDSLPQPKRRYAWPAPSGANRTDAAGVTAHVLRGPFQRHLCHVIGGAVRIARPVAKTMTLSLALTAVINAVRTKVFLGTDPNLPIAT